MKNPKQPENETAWEGISDIIKKCEIFFKSLSEYLEKNPLHNNYLILSDSEIILLYHKKPQGTYSWQTNNPPEKQYKTIQSQLDRKFIKSFEGWF